MASLKKIAVVGGGPSGLAVAKALAAEPANFSIDLFEAQQEVGGLWNYNSENKHSFVPQVPSTSPLSTDIQVNKPTAKNGYISPMYKHLETNIVKEIMQYAEVPFPESNPKFPSRQEVAEYLRSYASTIAPRAKIHLNTKVTGLEKIGSQWHIALRDLASQKEFQCQYDAVVLAHGHFQTPYIPQVEGLREWNSQHPNTISHAKFYDKSGDYRGKTVLIVGNSASGIDLSTQISTVAKKVYLSCREPDELMNLKNPLVTEIGLIKQYDSQTKSVTTVGEEVVEGIDSVIFCTGYLYSVPFLKTNHDDIVTTNGFRFSKLYREIFYIPDPSLMFVGLQKLIIPMPFAENQAVYIARVLSGRLALPEQAEMLDWYDAKAASIKDDREFYNMGGLKDVNYMRELWGLVDSVKDGQGGHVASYADDVFRELREQTPKIKSKRLVDILDHARKLREKGEEFTLLR